MATTCDYCHKPLSLMRRLRGEQFCSVEHLDLFTGQQAELALERLAAIEDKPAAPRPPVPMLKRLTREVQHPLELPQAHEAATSTLRPLAEALNESRDQAATIQVEAPRLFEATVDEVSQAESDEAFSRLSEAFFAPPKEAAPPVPPPVTPKPVPEYPLAAFVSGVDVSPRAPMKDARLESFAPVDSWGKSTYPSAMPKLRSQPADLGEVRTWNAGKLAAKVPPPAPTREFLAGKEPTAFAGPRGNVIEPESVSAFEAIPQLPALAAQVDAVKAEWVGADTQRMLSLTAGFRFQPTQLNAGTIEVELGPEDFQRAVLQPAHHWIPSGINAAPEYASARTAARALAGAREGEFTPVLEGFSTPDARPAHHWSPSAASVLPEHAAVRILARVPLSGSLVAESSVLEYLVPEGRAAEFESARPEIGWAAAIPMKETWRSCPPAPSANSYVRNLAAFDADFVPNADVMLPAPPAWSFTEKFEAGTVPMPVWQSAPVLAPARPMLSWTGDEETSTGSAEFTTTVTMPGMPGTVLTVGRMGPSFGWEQKSAQVGSGPERNAVEPSVQSAAAIQLQALRAKLLAVPSPTSLIGPVEHPLLNGNEIVLPSEDRAVAPAAAAPRYDDFRARVRTGLPPGDRRGYREWAQPRFDHSMIVTEPIAASRPALAEVHADMEQPYRISLACFETTGAVATPLSVLAGGVPEAMAFSGATVNFAPMWTNRSLTVGAPKVLQTSTANSGPRALAGGFSSNVQTAGALRYSPVTLVVVPPPQFELLKGVLGVEDRFAAQGPVNLRTAPRIRATGFRMMGPFPKLPPCVPASTFVLKTPEFAPALQDVPLHGIVERQDVAGLPQVSVIPGGLRLHPADYWAWPAIKAPHTSRVAAEIAETEPPTSGPVRRFGPGRASLQTKSKSADGPRRGA